MHGLLSVTRRFPLLGMSVTRGSTVSGEVVTYYYSACTSGFVFTTLVGHHRCSA